MLLASVAAAAGAAAGGHQDHATREPAGASLAAVVPKPGQELPVGTRITGECRTEDGRESGHVASWELNTVIPRFKHGGSGGEILAPIAKSIPRIANAPDPPQGPFKNEWIVQPMILALAGSGIPGGCQLQSFDPLRALTVEQPGPYVLVQYDHTVHWRATTGSVEDVHPQACADNNPEFPDPADIMSPPEFDDERQWAIDAFCNKVSVTGFYVTSKGSCSGKADMSRWSNYPYINQYDAGARLRLPAAQSDRRRGGNACGPSSLMMAMLSGGSRGLPTLPRTYDRTMQRTAAQMAAAPPKKRNNSFAGQNAVAFLKSLGWKSARTHILSADVEEMERTILSTMDGKYPVVISTAFGTNRWGVTGGGHMIALVGADKRGNFIVDDPAGNFFGSWDKHYGPGQCGHRAAYPHFWVLAYVTSRWMLELGKRTPPKFPFLAETTAPYGTDDAAGLFTARDAQATPKYGTAFSIFDTHPGAKDPPESFFLQDARGRRAGWVEGRPVSEIPDASVSQDPPGWTDPSVGDESLAKPGDPDPTPRAIVVPKLDPGTKLFVSAKRGARFALTAMSWQDGSVVTSRPVQGKGTGVPAIVSSSR